MFRRASGTGTFKSHYANLFNEHEAVPVSLSARLYAVDLLSRDIKEENLRADANCRGCYIKCLSSSGCDGNSDQTGPLLKLPQVLDRDGEETVQCSYL